MFYSDGRSRGLSKDLRPLVHQSLSESKQRPTRTAIDRGASKSKICESIKNVREGIHEPEMQDEFSRSTHSAMLDEFQGTALASRLLAKLQSQANAVL